MTAYEMSYTYYIGLQYKAFKKITKLGLNTS